MLTGWSKVPVHTFSIAQLAKRLTAIVEENEARGRTERNDLPMVLEVHRFGKRPQASFYYPITGASSAIQGKHFSSVDPEWAHTLDARANTMIK